MFSTQNGGCLFRILEHCCTRLLTAFHQILILMGEKRISEVHTGGVQGKQTFPIRISKKKEHAKKWSQKVGP